MKHLLLSAALLLFASNLIAQLSVRPSPSTNTDSYIYANDVVLYVHQGINLQVNNDAETRASIYLRGDSQLIQGDKPTSQNSGNGHLSVWQRGHANARDYNYWASPVGNPNDATIPTGNTRFGIPRIFDVGEDNLFPGELHKTFSTQQQTTWDLDGIASNVAVGDIGSLQISRRWIYTMRAATGYTSWVHIGHQNGLNGSGLAPGEGFTMKGTGLSDYAENYHNQLYDFRGRPNDGDITITVGHNGASFLETLTGNPYPSALDMADFLMDPDNNTIDGTAYYWDQNRETNSHYIYDYQGGYGTWVPSGGGDGNPGVYTRPVFEYIDGYGTSIGGTGEEGDLIQRRYAPIGQGFMVRGAVNGTAIFKNTMRRHVRQGQDTFSEFRNATGSSLSASTGPALPAEPQYLFPTLRFHVKVNDLYVRDMVMTFSPETTKGADRGWDGKHPSVINDGDAYWLLEDETHPYVIQARPFDEFDAIPLGIRKRNGNATYEVSVAEAHNFTNRMYLYDVVNNTYQTLSTNNRAQINLNGPAGNIENRFYIVFRRNIQDDQIPQRIADMNLGVFQNNPLSKLQVSNPDMYDIKNASVYDMRGRLVITQNNIGNVPRYEFSTQGLSSGVYLVVLTTTDNQMIDYKITVHNKN